MGVAQAEEAAGDLDRKVELGAGRKVAHVEITADAARRDDAVQTRRGGRQTDRAGEGLSGTAPPGPNIAGAIVVAS